MHRRIDLFRMRRRSNHLHDIVPGGALLASLMEHRGPLEKFVRARLGQDSGEADDVMQEIWLKVRRIEPESVTDHRSYLFRMATNLVSERYRSATRGRRRDAEWMQASGRDAEAAGNASAEQILLARELLTKVDTSLQKAGDRADRIFRRFRLDGVGQRQIAEEFGISLSTVEKELRKAYGQLAALRRQLDED